MSRSSSARVVIDLTGDDDVQISCDDLYPPPVDGENEYTVERILEIQNTAAGRMYRIKWFGYPMSQASWVKESMIVDCEDAILKYLNAQR